MIITPHPAAYFNIRAKHANDAPRTSGVHLSAIVRRMALDSGNLDKKYGLTSLSSIIDSTPLDQSGASSTITRLAIGMAVESWLIPHVQVWAPTLVHQPGEFTRDDIRVTPDGLDFHPETGRPILHEFKVTWQSMNKRKIESQFMYLCQIVGYAAALAPDFGYCQEAYLHVLYVNGDYNRNDPNGGPKYCVYRIELTEDEIERTWAEIVKMRDLVEPEAWGAEE